jgi:hypothetical protein
MVAGIQMATTVVPKSAAMACKDESMPTIGRQDGNQISLSNSGVSKMDG